MYNQPFQDLVNKAKRLLKKEGFSKGLYSVIWLVREYDYQRCRIRRRKAVLTEFHRCRRYEKLIGKTRREDPLARAYLQGAGDAMEWCLLPAKNTGPRPASHRAWDRTSPSPEGYIA